MTGGGFIHVAAHAGQRYQERLRPALTLRAATRDLERLLDTVAVRSDERPDWCGATKDGDEAEYYLVVGDTLACPVVEGIAVTTLSRGTVAPDEREARQRRKKGHRRYQRAMKLRDNPTRRKQRKRRGDRRRDSYPLDEAA